MLTDKPYNRSHFEALLPTEEREGMRIDESGVWPATDYEMARRLGLLPEYKALSWKPVFAYSGDGPAPDTKNIPGLPFPFDARDLAAFMLAGVGSFVAEFYGEWRDGPDEDALAEIDPGDCYARKAVNEAYGAYRDALKRVGGSDACLDEATQKLCRSSPEVHGVDWEQAQEKQEDAHQAWLKDMVRQLLQPVQEQTAAAPAPVMADSASNAPATNPLPVATGNIAHAFDGLRGWNEQAWKDNLGSPSKWLEACIALRGQRGTRQTHWNPVLVGAALVRSGRARQNSVRARFQTRPQLEDWREAWKTYEADNFDTQ